MKKPAYGLNDAAMRWWNILDSALRSCGLAPLVRIAAPTSIMAGRSPSQIHEPVKSIIMDLTLKQPLSRV